MKRLAAAVVVVATGWREGWSTDGLTARRHMVSRWT
jgi:hypothetical protein